MPESTQTEINRLLRAWSGGDARAVERLMPLVYDSLCGPAASFLRQENAPT